MDEGAFLRAVRLSHLRRKGPEGSAGVDLLNILQHIPDIQPCLHFHGIIEFTQVQSRLLLEGI